jgi:lysophospholipase L1-like esterase
MKLVLIGDSIRMGYQELVRKKIGDAAEVWAPPVNSGHSLMHRENFDAWYLAPQGDVIHFNCGIWDCVRLPDGARRFTLGTYLRNLKLVVQRLKATTKARLIFATTTPMFIPRDSTPLEKCRLDPAVVRYNKAAVALMEYEGLEVDDLFSAVMSAGAQKCLSADKVHMSEFGNEVLSDAVVNFVLGRKR